jgi:hypothetical protein
MTKTMQNFDYWTGTEKILRFTVTDEDGASVNLTGASVWWLLQDEPNSGSLIFLKTGGSGITVSGCTTDVVLAASLTEGCALSGTYHHQLSASGITYTPDVLAVGTVQIHRKLF